MSSDDQALREQIARAIHQSAELSVRLSLVEVQRLADAVLPVVQAHEKALRDGMEYVHADCEKALRDEVQEYRNAITWDTTCFSCSKLLDRCYAETQRAETAEEALSSLRDAVAQLADQNDDRIADVIEDALDAAHGASHYDCCFNAHHLTYPSANAVKTRLRSLLPQEGPK
jgi:hypothetical protein